ncbi:MAG: D-alanyl-D-alanine carboxypeptidase [Oscillospiraceae bacterium]|nr:D-alanyl-D-alanine carboxypeptidase [Oscillospiraceae bacterium]
MKIRRFLSVFLLILLLSTLYLPGAAAIEEMHVAAKAAVLVDGNTGEVLYGQNEHQQLYPASVTKITTALLVMEAVDAGKLSYDDMITVPASALAGLAADGSTANIKEGEIISARDLMYCMMVASANEACNILAEKVSGSVSAFVEDMNARVSELGCENTHYVNTTGLHDLSHYSSAWDIYLITKEAMQHEEFMEFCNATAYTVPATNLSPERTFHTTNSLLDNWNAIGYMYEYAQGVKTGHTSDAGYCLVSSAVKGEKKLISVVLGAERVNLEDGTRKTQSFTETARLFEWGFNNFSVQEILSSTEMIQELPVALSNEASYVALHPDVSLSATLPNDITAEELVRTVTLYQDSVNAPVTEGTAYGEISISYNGEVRGTAKLVAYSSVSTSKFLTLKYQLSVFFAKPVVKIGAIVLAALIVVFLFYRIFFVRRRKNRYGSSRRHVSNYRGRRR